ncbi:MAG: ferritin-like domain-containing protein [Pseudomonadota bacterium]|nr:ferritin-like domain-containing protein [Pseudomonadota bacterium]
MTDDQLIETPDAAPNSDRREFFRSAIGATAAAVVGVGAVTAASRAFADTTTDVDVLNFALTLKYLQAQFYSFAAFGTGLTAAQISGTGTAGAATGARMVAFTDPLVAQYAAEIAGDKVAHVNWLRGELGAGAVAQPAIDLGTAATGAFSVFMGAAGVVTSGSSFDPYANDTNFLLAAFLLEDVGVTALKGAASSITDKGHIEAGAGMLGTDAYHAAMIRTTLYVKGAANPTLRTQADSISSIRDRLDGPAVDDQGISPTTVNGNLLSNIVPAAADGTVFGRIPGGVLNIFYENSASVTKGGFFPNGINGTITASTQN